MENKKRLIDANALGRDSFHIREYGYDGERCVVDWGDIESAPTVDAVEVVHGWTEVIEPFNVTLTTRCGLCGVAMGNLDNYCPNCGAKMDGEKNNEN